VDRTPARFDHARRNRPMTDLERLGLALVGFAVAVVVAGVLLGLIGARITRGRG